MRPIALALAVFVCSTAADARRVSSFFRRDELTVRSAVAAPRLAALTTIAPAVTLPAAVESASDRIDEIREWNARGLTPAKDGFTRSTIDPVAVVLSSAAVAKTGVARSARGYVASTARGVVWSGSFKVEKAYRLRLHLEDVSLPDGAVMWVYGSGDTPVTFGAELVHGRELWTPSVAGDTIHLEIETPLGTVSSFVVRELIEIVSLAVVKPLDASCLVDSACALVPVPSVIAQLRAATAQLSFVNGANSYICTGGLINDAHNSGTPYLLTASHCIGQQAVASSLEAYWDYGTAECGAVPPERSSSPRSNGATLLATSAGSDFTVLQLKTLPAGRWLLGWDAHESVLNRKGLALYRLSHPRPEGNTTPLPQAITEGVLDTSTASCSGIPRPRFFYSKNTQGATWGGSSGAPVVYAESGVAYVIGQLWGDCGPKGSSDCDRRRLAVDGAFASTYAAISELLETQSGITPAPCVATATTMCLGDNRFAVTAQWTSAERSGYGEGVRLTPDTGYFWFFASTNVEIVVKVLNSCSAGSRFWVFAGGLTNVNVVLRVRDTRTGEEKVYTNPTGTAFQPIQDTNAFASCP